LVARGKTDVPIPAGQPAGVDVTLASLRGLLDPLRSGAEGVVGGVGRAHLPVDAAHERPDLTDELLAVGVRGVVVGRHLRGGLVRPPGRIIQPARSTSAANTKVHEPIPLRSRSAARSPSVSWSSRRTPG
jgi:hypothetical protein